MKVGFIIFVLEILVTVVFTLIAPGTLRKFRLDVRSIVKGLIERAFLTYSLLSGFPHALTLFGALKLGTRLKRADNERTAEGRKEESLYNDYYLMGNFISVILSMVYFSLLKGS